MRAAAQAFLAILLAAVASFALAQDYAGIVKTVKGVATAERGGSQIVLTPGAAVHQGDRISTGSEGYLGITMKDDTLLTLGPGSALNLESYRFDPKTHDGNFAAYLGKGVLSVVTGLIPKAAPDAFVVRTRISTMGVRGTEFIVEASD
ncbi:MAG TPA: FecR domain-containing protein [Burkholderiales bacterium]|nr:FecR domain-containing protein [Burkholderiales bacterium]